MSLGPLELLVVKFPGNHFTGEIIPALSELVDSRTIRIVDLLFVRKHDGALDIVELNDIEEDDFAAFEPLVDELTGLFNEDDARQLAEQLDDNSSAALMLFENTWATRLRDSIVNAHGQLVFNERIPRAVVDRMLEEAETVAA